MSALLTKKLKNFYQASGYAYVDDFFTNKQIKDLIQYVDEIEEFKEMKNKWMKYYVSINNKPLLIRTEFFFDYHSKIKKIFFSSKFLKFTSFFLGGKSKLFKEKINFKLPGTPIEKPHQDAQVDWNKYGISKHITFAIAIDKVTYYNGCLDVSPGNHKKGLLGEMWRPLSKKITSKLKWKKITMQPGSILVFDSYAPHRSSANNSKSKRRIIFLTYNLSTEGNHRLEYFKEKRLGFPPNIERKADKKYSYKV